MKHNIIIIGVLFISFTFFAVGQPYTTSLSNPDAFSKIGVSSWASGGTGVAERGLSSAAFNNPACLDFQSLTFSTEMSGRLKTEFFFGNDYDGFVIVPSLLTVGGKIDDWNIAGGYLNYYDRLITTQLIDFSDYIYYRTNEKAKNEMLVRTVFGSVNRSSENFSFGFTIGLNYLTDEEHLFYNNSGSGNGFGALFTAGILSKLNDNLDLGISIKYTTPINYTLESNDGSSYDYSAKFPIKIESGISAKLSPTVTLLTSVEYHNNSNVSSYINSIFQIHAGSIFALSEYTNLRAGFFTDMSPNEGAEDELNQYFISVGMDVKVERLNIAVSFLDSHLFTPANKFHQTIISLGGTYKFD